MAEERYFAHRMLQFARLCALAWVAASVPTHAAEILVDTSLDLIDASGDCSLREAIAAANTDAAVDGCAAGSGADTIRFAAALDGVPILLTDATDGALALVSGSTVAVVGNGRTKTIITACEDIPWIYRNQRGDVTPTACVDQIDLNTGLPYRGIKDRVFALIAPSTSLTLSHLTVANGFAFSGLTSGGGILANTSTSALVVDDVWFRGNVAPTSNGRGGAIASSGPLTVTDSQFGGDRSSVAAARTYGNIAVKLGGAIYADLNRPLSIARSTFFGNTAKQGAALFTASRSPVVTESAFVYNMAVGETVTDATGGTLLMGSFASAAIANSTITDNDAGAGYTPGIQSLGNVTLSNVTIANNRASAGIARSLLVGGSGMATVVNSILTGGDDRPDCGLYGGGGASVVSGGHNHVLDPGACGFAATGDVTAVDPGLSYGGRFLGPSQTFALASNSPALDSADVAVCAAAPVSGRDQRGYSRPFGPGCDRGAFEAGHAYCPIGKIPVNSFSEDFESGAPGWSSDGSGSPWAASTARSHGGTTSWHVALPSGASTDARLHMPTISLPAGRSPLSLQFWSYRDFGPADFFTSLGVQDTGGRLEVSTDAGTTWQGRDGEDELFAGLGSINMPLFDNDQGGYGLWGTTPWRSTTVRLDDFAEQTVELRFRAGNASSNSHEGWYVDDVAVVGCCWEATCTAIFANGFEPAVLPGPWSTVTGNTDVRFR